MDYIKFLGTAGARFVVMKQLRASGGMWLSLAGMNILVDPGPGCLVRALSSRPKLEPSKADIIFLSHKHLDHSCDINLMVEVMTQGGRKKRGTLFTTADSLEDDAVVLNYLRDYPERIEVINEGCRYNFGDISLFIPVRHNHSVETYGFSLLLRDAPYISYISDTGFFDGLIDSYRGSKILIINTLLFERIDGIEHLSLPEAEEIIREIMPEKAVLTHLGMTMLQNRVWEKAEDISRRTSVEVIVAYDGMKLNI